MPRGGLRTFLRSFSLSPSGPVGPSWIRQRSPLLHLASSGPKKRHKIIYSLLCWVRVDEGALITSRFGARVLNSGPTRQVERSRYRIKDVVQQSRLLDSSIEGLKLKLKGNSSLPLVNTVARLPSIIQRSMSQYF